MLGIKVWKVFQLTVYLFCQLKPYAYGLKAFFAFEVFLLCEPQTDMVAITSSALAIFRDSTTEAGQTAAIHAKVTIRTVAWKEQVDITYLQLSYSFQGT